ncbi:MAG: hypothetical protein GY842_12340, partial [bacterium]|nr:hypothetical protein [bacterium]
PISSPPLAICQASGYYSMKELPKLGGPFMAVAFCALILVIVLYWPMVGVPFVLE